MIDTDTNSNDTSNGKSSKRKTFDPTFNLGHLLTVFVIIVGVFGSVITLKDGLKDGLAEMRSENKVQDQRIDAMTKENTRLQAEDVAFRTEVRQSLTNLSSAIADLRVQLANATNSTSPPRK